MMTRVFLAAGVAALAIAAPASAGPHGGGKPDRAAFAGGGGGGQRAQSLQSARASFAAPRMQRAERMAPQMQRAQRMAPQMQRMAPQMERAQRFAAFQRPQRAERIQMRAQQPARADRFQMRADRAQARVADRQQLRQNRVQQVQARQLDRQQVRSDRMQQVQNRLADRQQVRMDRMQQVQNRIADRQQLRAARIGSAQLNGQGFGVGGCPPGLAGKGCMPPGQASKLGFASVVTANNAAGLRAARIDGLNRTYGTRILAPTMAASLLGLPIAQASGISPLVAVPQSVSYLYPDTPNYYYRYGDGYMYQVDRGSNLISALLPLLAGGLMPGQYLPQPYMSSYVPSAYGLNSFYPSSYDAGYGYGSAYNNVCNRYANGVIYQVDCMTGMIEDVVPMYAGGYGVGQMLPSAYTTYNVPQDYRSMYYNTADAGYYYAPGAIYQYDPSSSLITSVAALMTPGFSVGQSLPMGYDVYNVPYQYRQTYYDTPNAWYRYNNGNIYQIDPTTQLVTAIVASLLT